MKELLSPLPVKKKAKNERNSITTYFNRGKNNDEQKENKSQCQSKATISDKKESKKLTNETNTTKRRSKTKPEEKPIIQPDNQFLSSVQVEKTSLI
ncbi:unnamed protein product, partial [Rotaria magnacalcarata]